MPLRYTVDPLGEKEARDIVSFWRRRLGADPRWREWIRHPEVFMVEGNLRGAGTVCLMVVSSPKWPGCWQVVSLGAVTPWRLPPPLGDGG